MKRGSQTKKVDVHFSEALVDNTSPSGAYGDSSPVSIDTQGFGFCVIYCRIGTTTNSLSTLRVMEGAAAASGADDSTYSEVSGTAHSGTTGNGRLPQADDDGETFKIEIDCRGGERYLAVDAVVANESTGAFLQIWAELFEGDEEPFDATAMGCASLLSVIA